MAIDLAELVVRMELENSKLHTNLEKSEKKLKKFGSTTDRVSKAAKSALSGIGVALSVAGFSMLIKDAVKASSEIDNLTKRLGGTTEEWSRLKHASEESEVGFQVVAMAAQRSTRRIAEAAQGTGEAVDALNELGLSANKLKALTPTQQMHVLADALKGVESQSDKVRLAMKLFDSEGVRVLQMLEGGSAGLREYAEESDRLGKTLDREGVDKMQKLDKVMKDMDSSTTALGNTLAIALGPTLAEIASWLGDKIPAAAEFAVEGFKALRHAALETVQIISEDLAINSDWLSHIPGPVGDYFEQSAKKLRAFSVEIEETQRRFALGKKDFGEFSVKANINTQGLDAFAGQNEKISESSKRSNTALKEANKLIQDRQRLINSVMTPQEKFNDQLLQLNLLRERLASTKTPLENETYLRAVTRYQDELEKALEGENKLSDAAKELGMTFSSAFEGAALNGAELSDVLKGLAQDFARIALRKTVTEPLANWAGDLFSGLGFADGGRPPLGQASLIGERGPELFVPDTAGTIVPNHALGGASVTLQQDIQIDARGSAPGMETRIEEAVARGAQRGYELVAHDIANRGPIRRSL